MKTSLVYILVSTVGDFFYEQTLISAWSARYWNPNAKIYLVTDDLTNQTLQGNRTKLFQFVDEKIVVNLSEAGNKYTGKERSRMLKTNIREYVPGDILFIDSDTVICAPLSDIDLFTFPVGAVWDGNRPFNAKDLKRSGNVIARARLLGKDVIGAKDYFNSGVLYMKDTPEVHTFMAKWHALYMSGQNKGLSFDQPSFLSLTMDSNIVATLEGIYNCQILNGGLPYLADAKIIHASNVYGNTPFFGLADPDFYKKIKKNGALDQIDQSKIICAKRQFADDYELVYDSQLKYWHSSLRHLFLYKPKFFAICEFIGRILKKLPY